MVELIFIYIGAMEIWQYLIVIFGGLLAGFMNSLAGYGSLVSLAILMEVIGLPPNIANATNRVNVGANVLAGSTAFYKNGKLKLNKTAWFLAFVVLLGAIGGSLVASNISDDNFRNIYRVLILLVGILLIFNPKKWLITKSQEKKPNYLLLTPILLALGFYGGLIQAGLGMFILATLVLLLGKELIEANALKMFIILVYTFVVIAIFHSKGLIDWKAGALLAVSQGTGSFLTANYVSKMPKANLYAYRLLIIIVFFIMSRELYLLFGHKFL